MLQFTIIARQSDALPLSADAETSGGSDLERHKMTAKNLLRRLANTNVPTHMTVESSTHAFHILCEGGTLFLTMCDLISPATVAFAYLEDVSREFLQQYGEKISTATRPYSFIKFDLYLQKTKPVFSSASSSRNASLMQRQGRPIPVKRSFRDVMGYGDGPDKTTTNADKGDVTFIILGAGISLAVVILIVLLLVFLL